MELTEKEKKATGYRILDDKYDKYKLVGSKIIAIIERAIDNSKGLLIKKKDGTTCIIQGDIKTKLNIYWND